MAEIPDAKTIKGVNPKDFLNDTLILTVCIPEGENDTVISEKRENKKDGGEFTQWSVFGKDSEGNDRVVQYLFAADLQAVKKAYTKDSLKWVGRQISVRGVKDGKYYKAILTPVEA